MKNPENLSTAAKPPRKKRLKRVLIALLCGFLIFQFILHPVAIAIGYECIFAMRFQPVDWMEFSASDFENLTVHRSDFQTKNGKTLAGFAYSQTNDDGQDKKGVVVFSHGLGIGGHNFYMPFIDYFTQNGYLAFAYDGTGNGESGGDITGLPQGVIDLDFALRHVKSAAEYQNLPIVLFGHSWGGYAVGSVLNFHSDVRAVAMLAAFNSSKDQLVYQSVSHAGIIAYTGLPYLTLYEKLKFGKSYATASVVNGLKFSEAWAVIVQSADDPTVLPSHGYDIFLENFKDNERVEFVFYTDRGHKNILFSDDALAYQDEMNAAYERYLTERNAKHSEKLKSEFMQANLDKLRCFAPNESLMQTILGVYNARCTA